MQMEDLIAQLDIYAQKHGFSKRELADRLGIPYNTLKKWFFERESRRRPSEAYIDKIKDFLESEERPDVYQQMEEARHRTEKIKYLLILLEDELRWFRDNSPQSREIFRKELDAYDIGYISSLLTMLTEEDKFRRWLALTTIQFQSFKRR